MKGNKTFKSLPVEFFDLNKWPKIDISALSMVEQERFSRMQKGIEIYLSSGKLTLASTEAGCSGGELLRQLNRCISSTRDGGILGWAGLIKYLHIKSYERTAVFSSGLGINGKGTAGLFQKFLEEHESIRKEIVSLVLKGTSKSEKRDVHESRITCFTIYKKFLRMCLEEGVQDGEYPFNTRSRGKRSVYRYIQEIIQENPRRGVAARYGKDAAHMLSVGVGNCSLSPFFTSHMTNG